MLNVLKRKWMMGVWRASLSSLPYTTTTTRTPAMRRAGHEDVFCTCGTCNKIAHIYPFRAKSWIRGSLKYIRSPEKAKGRERATDVHASFVCVRTLANTWERISRAWARLLLHQVVADLWSYGFSGWRGINTGWGWTFVPSATFLSHGKPHY